MKESIGQAFLVNLILVFFLVLILMLLGSINYSKAYKVKNRIITILEKYGTSAESGSGLSTEAQNEINVNLKKAGYANSKKGMDCAKYNNLNGTILYPDSSAGLHYNYCVIKIDAGTTDGRYETPTVSGVTYDNARYYKVITFMEFDIPLIGGFLKFPIQGETKLIYDVIS